MMNVSKLINHLQFNQLILILIALPFGLLSNASEAPFSLRPWKVVNIVNNNNLTVSSTTNQTWFKGVIKSESNKCSRLRVRPNILSYNGEQVEQYIDAVKQLYFDGTIDRLASFHQKHYFATHNQPLIFWWHRYFIYQFENELRRINSNLTIPYWDTTEDSEEPHKSIVLSDKYFGGNGSAPFNCIANGFLQFIHTKLPDGHDHCIRRAFDGPSPNTLNPWHDTQLLVLLTQLSTKSDMFRVCLEDTVHLDVHRGLGFASKGFMNTPMSPLDPIFFLHHSNLDRWLYTWQLSKRERFEMIDGEQLLYNRSSVILTKDYVLDGYENVTLDSILRIEEEPMCYTYDYLPLDKLTL